MSQSKPRRAFPRRVAWAVANSRGWLSHTPVGSSPHLDSDALLRWRRALANAEVYLEYGSGGSTVEAVQSASHVVSVETDGRYLGAVASTVAETNAAKASFHPVHVDIGWTERWGRPLFTRRSETRLERWRGYSSAPWAVLEGLGLVPDFIFVDGRFRAASVLESLLRLPDDADCLLMLDDFVGREQIYNVVLAFAGDVERAGRTLVFRRDPAFDRDECRRLLRRFQSDPD